MPVTQAVVGAVTVAAVEKLSGDDSRQAACDVTYFCSNLQLDLDSSNGGALSPSSSLCFVRGAFSFPPCTPCTPISVSTPPNCWLSRACAKC
jgi:hypothetical protein